MDKRLCEISGFFVTPPRMFPLSVQVLSRASTDLFIHKFLYLSILSLQDILAASVAALASKRPLGLYRISAASASATTAPHINGLLE